MTYQDANIIMETGVMSTAVYAEASAVTTEPSLTVAAGHVLTLAGAVFAAANLFQYGVISGLLHLSPAALSLSWPVALVVFFTLLFRLRRGGGTNVRRVATWSRMAIGFQIAAALSLLALSITRHNFSFMFWTSPIGLMAYAVAWMTAAVRSRTLWMIAPSLGALAAAGVVIALLGTAPAYLAYAAGLGAFVLIPGLLLARKTGGPAREALGFKA